MADLDHDERRNLPMPNLAVLIDAENVLPAHAEQIFTYAAAAGNVAVKEIYGAAQALTAWVEPVLKYALHANLTIRASKGKNTSDIALVIGAMDLLVQGNIDTVIIASSDSDFSALSVRLRSAGVEVTGMGTEKANPLWRTACSNFVVLQAPAFRPAPVQQIVHPKPAAKKEAPAPKKEAPPAPAPAAAPKKPVTHTTHTGRMTVIRSFIKEQLEANGGKMPVAALLSSLSGLQEYRVDQQGSKRNPINYLMRLYGDTFQFEDEGEGNHTISLRASGGEGEQKPASEQPEKEAPAAAPLEEEAPTALEPAAEEPQQEAPSVEAPEEEAAQSAPESASQAPDPFTLLTQAGVAEDTARQIAAILAESADLRTVYNKLRATFGNSAGREYYQTLKDIAKKYKQ